LPFDEDMLRRFFPDNDGDGKPDVPEDFGNGGGDGEGFALQGTGSGVIMEAQGSTAFIVTNNHVAGGASEIRVTLADGRVVENGKVVGTDAKTDLAVIKIDADRIIPAKWGDSDDLQKGDWIMAFGSPFGYVGSMTHGIVSALNRTGVGILGQHGYENFIQVDAPINPGNSGGPLVNVKGEVVGINTAIATRNGGFQGIGFAIPSNQAKFVYAALKEKGKVTRGWLGVAIRDVAQDAAGIKEAFHYPANDGVIVHELLDNSPVEGKLKRGDIITEMNGKPVKTVQELRNAIAATPPGSELKLKVFRGQKMQDVSMKIGEQPENMEQVSMRGGRGTSPRSGSFARESAAELRGMTLANPTDEVAQKLGLKAGEIKGAVVTEVKPRTPAFKAGLRPGDVITEVAQQPVADAKEAAEAIAKQDKGKMLLLYVTNSTAGASRFVFVEPQK
jgi:serine protease Do